MKYPVKLSRLKTLPPLIRNEIIEDLEKKSAINVKILAYIVMPNHFHFLLQQISENGISIFVSKFTNSYTRYFNTKYDRVGPIFQGVFKAVHIETEEQLLHLSRYIHINAVVSEIITKQELFSFPWSSLPEYKKNKSFLVDSS